MGARLDYADALAGTGQSQAARQLLREVLKQPDIPPEIAENVRQALAHSELTPWRHASALTFRLGHDSNLNRATQASQLALTLPEGEILLPLDPASRQRSGASHFLEWSSQSKRPLNGAEQIQIFTELRQRISSDAQNYDYTQFDAALLWSLPMGEHDRENQFGLGMGALHFGSDDIYQYLRINAARDWSRENNRRFNLEAAIEQRRHPQNADLDHHYLQAQATWLDSKNSYHVKQLSIGREYAEHDRPGGNAWRMQARITDTREFGAGQIETDLRVSARRDDTAFSPLLNNGAALNLNAISLRLEYRQHISAGWHALLGIQGTKQMSNIALFEMDSISMHLGLRRYW